MAIIRILRIFRFRFGSIKTLLKKMVAKVYFSRPSGWRDRSISSTESTIGWGSSEASANTSFSSPSSTFSQMPLV